MIKVIIISNSRISSSSEKVALASSSSHLSWWLSSCWFNFCFCSSHPDSCVKLLTSLFRGRISACWEISVFQAVRLRFLNRFLFRRILISVCSFLISTIHSDSLSFQPLFRGISQSFQAYASLAFAVCRLKPFFLPACSSETYQPNQSILWLSGWDSLCRWFRA